MTGPAFSPGPWQVSCVRTRLGGEPVLQILAADGKWYATVFYSDKTPEEHRASYADAHLIAAAPDLYAALQECLREHGGFFLAGGCERQARAALAKARGEVAQ